MTSVLHPTPSRSYARFFGLAFILLGLGLIIHHLVAYFPYTPGKYTDPGVYFDRKLWADSIPLVYYGSLIGAGVGLLLRASWTVFELAFFGFMVMEGFVSALLGWSPLPFPLLPGLLMAGSLLVAAWLLYLDDKEYLRVQQITLGTLFGVLLNLLIP
jgi:hypothetical protein